MLYSTYHKKAYLIFYLHLNLTLAYLQLDYQKCLPGLCQNINTNTCHQAYLPDLHNMCTLIIHQAYLKWSLHLNILSKCQNFKKSNTQNRSKLTFVSLKYLLSAKLALLGNYVKSLIKLINIFLFTNKVVFNSLFMHPLLLTLPACIVAKLAFTRPIFPVFIELVKVVLQAYLQGNIFTHFFLPTEHNNNKKHLLKYPLSTILVQAGVNLIHKLFQCRHALY